MTKEEIKTLVAEKIAGQGSMVDVGGGLPKILNGIVDVIPEDIIPTAVSTTWAELKAKRDNGELLAGAWYRITDYVATTSQEGTRSANHPFDVLVLAISGNKLSESALAVQHEGDTYFANSNLSAWKLMYSLDNDNRFDWADANGKGVIYRLVDEFNNSVPFDFKGIQFQRSLLNVEGGKPVLTNLANWYGPDYNNNERLAAASNAAYNSLKNRTDFCLFYSLGTGGVFSVGDGEHDDLDNYLRDELDWQDGDAYIILSENDDYGAQVIAKTSSTSRYLYLFTSPEGFDANTKLADQSAIVDASLLGGVFSNEFGDYVEGGARELGNNVVIGNDFYSNTIGNNFYSNTIGNNFYSNTIGNSFNYNTIGNDFYSNTIGNNFYYNTIGYSFNYNTIGNDFYSNTIGNNFYSNTIGNNFYSNTIGNSFNYNTIGNSFNSNTIGNSFNSNTIGNNFYNNTFDAPDDIRYCYLTSGVNNETDIPVVSRVGYPQIVGYDSENTLIVKPLMAPWHT